MRLCRNGTIASVATLMVGFACRADASVFKCSYTEPFLTTVFDAGARTISVVHDVESRKEFIRNVRVGRTAAGALELRNNGRLVQRIDLKARGSDGMSDRSYSYKGEWFPEKVQGGCERVR